MTMYDDMSDDEMLGVPVSPDAAEAAEWARRRAMDNVGLAMTLHRSLHATWPANRAHAVAALWHYGTRAIAGDYE